jgi:RND family efflux transporter MFP subunit
MTSQYKLSVCAAALLASLAPVAAQANPYECLIEPSQVVEIRSPVEGVIEKVHVKRGDRVRAGQVLVQLESAPEASALELAKYRSTMEGRIASSRNRLDFSTRKAARAQELKEQKFLAAQAWDEAEAERRVAAAELRDAMENRELARHEARHSADLLNRRTLRSPFNGVVVDRMLNPGDLAESGTGRKPILKLAQVEPLRVEVVLPISAYGKIKTGSSAQVAPESIGGRHPAKVTLVDSVFDSASGTFGVRLEIANANGALPAGIRCQVEFTDTTGLPPRGAKPKL